jgi:secreted trypsin-like serine protease
MTGVNFIENINNSSLFSQDSFELMFGAQNRSVDEDGTVSMTSKNAVYHKGYQESTLKNDIAIITLPKPITETSNEKVLNFP